MSAETIINIVGWIVTIIFIPTVIFVGISRERSGR